jgi:hypothetical protein
MTIYDAIKSGAVKSVQRGVTQPSSASTPVQVTISAVNPKKSIILVNSTSYNYPGCYGYFVTNDVIAIGGYTVNLHWQVVEFN